MGVFPSAERVRAEVSTALGSQKERGNAQSRALGIP